MFFILIVIVILLFFFFVIFSKKWRNCQILVTGGTLLFLLLYASLSYFHFDQNLTKFDQNLPNLTKICHFDQNLTKFDQNLPSFWPKSALFWPKSDHIWPKSDYFWPKSPSIRRQRQENTRGMAWLSPFT